MDDSHRERRPANWLARIAHLSDSPRRTATAFAVGVFLSFSPFFGLQIAVAIGLAVALRLNRIAVLAGLCANLPWIMVPWYAVTTTIGAAVLGVPIAEDFAGRLSSLLELPVYRTAFWERAASLFEPFIWPFVIGSTLGALVVAAVAYAVMIRLIARVHRARAIDLHP